MIQFVSTRGDAAKKTFTEVLLSGMAPDGGLYVPVQWPRIDVDTLSGLPYTEIAYRVINPFTEGEIPENDLREMIVEVYENEFKHTAVAPLVQPLDRLAVGDLARIAYIVPRDAERLVRLSDLGVIPGATIRLRQKRPAISLAPVE